MKDQVAEWLCRLEGITGVSPVTLVIEDETWEGAIYKQRDKWRYYMVGKRPKSHIRRARTCYQFAGCAYDWYVAIYLDKYDKLLEAQKRHHPFGESWVLMAWTAQGKIDDGLPTYTRISVVDAEIG